MSTGSDNDSRQPDDDYDVGYRKPPVANRFKPGNQAARKKGRPKGRRNKATILREIAEMRVEITLPGGVRKKVSMWEATAYRHAVNGAKGNVRSWEKFNQLLEQHGIAFDAPADHPIDPAEKLAVDDYFRAWAHGNPERAIALLEELAPTGPSDNAPNGRVSERSTGRRVDFSKAETPSKESHRSRNKSG